MILYKYEGQFIIIFTLYIALLSSMRGEQKVFLGVPLFRNQALSVRLTIQLSI